MKKREKKMLKHIKRIEKERGEISYKLHLAEQAIARLTIEIEELKASEEEVPHF